MYHVGYQRARQAVQSAVLLPVVTPLDLHLAIDDLDRNTGRNALRQGALRSLDANAVPFPHDRHAVRDRYGSSSDSRHRYQISQTTSPPTWASRADRSERIPLDVEITAVPSPLRTRGTSLLPT